MAETPHDNETSSRQPKMNTYWTTRFFYGWVIVVVVFIAEFVASGMGILTIGLFFTPIKESMGWSLTQLTGAVTAQGIAAMLIAPFIGPAIDRFGARIVMLFGAVSASLGMIFLARIEEFWQLWVLFAVVGALGLHELGNLTGPVVISKWFVRRRGRAMALATTGTVIGAMTMTPIIGLLISNVGWREAWQYMGISVLVITLLPVAIFMRSRPEDVGLLPDGDGQQRFTQTTSSQNPQSKSYATEHSWTLKQALCTRSLWLIVISMNLASLAASVQIVHTAPFLTQQEGLSTSVASFIIMARLTVAAVSRIPWGLLVERIPVRFCLALTFSIRAFGLLSMVIFPFPIYLPVFVIFSGMGTSLGLLQPMVFANYFGREFQGTIQGFMRPFLAGPGLAVPLIAAILFDATGTFDIAFLVMTIPGLLAVPLILLAKPPTPNSPTPRPIN